MTARAKQTFVEDVAVQLEVSGIPRMCGRVFGALLLADPPEMTADELVETLQVSRGSISTATRALERMKLIERVAKPGIRKDYFRNRPGAWPALLHDRLATLTNLSGLVERGLQLIDSDDPEVRRGLVEMLEYLDFMQREFPKLVDRWSSTREHGAGSAEEDAS